VIVETVQTPDSGDQRHQLYVQWLNAGASTPDVLQLDVVWTAELASAGWILPLAEGGLDLGDVPAAVLAADRWQGRLYALPLFVDVGMLYWRTDLVDHAPATLAELATMALSARGEGRVRDGLALQGARYEGLVTGFLEILGGEGGAILDADGRVVVDSPAAVRALTYLREAIDRGVVPRAALGWQEEQARFAFQNGDALFMRNWPYAYPLLADARTSKVAGRFAVAPMPAAPGGTPTAALGGAQLAINAHTRHAAAARDLVDFLIAPEQLVERARLAGQYPARAGLYRSGALDGVLPIPAAQALAVIEHATARPVTPVYAELSAALQVQLHRTLSGQTDAAPALAEAARDLRAVLARTEAVRQQRPPRRFAVATIAIVLLAASLTTALLVAYRRRRTRHLVRPRHLVDARDERLAWRMAAPAALIVLVFALLPLAWNVWESLHAHDLRFPAQGRPFVGIANYAAIAADARFGHALAHTFVFVLTTVTLEIVLGLTLALLLHRLVRARGFVRTVALLPWAMPTVVAGLVWRFLFADEGLVNAALVRTGVAAHGPGWFVDALYAWVPLVLADVWKTTPFVMLLFLAGRQAIDESLYDAARTDGASPWRQLREITLPLLRPTLLVVLIFRSLEAFRVLDLIYVLTGGGPGTATESISLLTYGTLLRDLRFGAGAAMSVVIFAIAAALALVYLKLLGGPDASATEPRR
jgi:ABC-type sugar transport system permease subunit/ABC-type glycerol-3-phosphate transport system substrate-binding protein